MQPGQNRFLRYSGSSLPGSAQTAGYAFQTAVFSFPGWMRPFSLPADITMGGVEVIETGSNESVCHADEFIMVHSPVLHGQPHAAKAKVAVDLREKWILNHAYSSCCETAKDRFAYAAGDAMGLQ